MSKISRSRSGRTNAGERGFTLVELLIVIVILGVLAGIVVFAVGNLTSNAKTNACATEKSTITAALESYKARNGSYPSGADAATRMGLLTSPASTALLKSTPASYQITDNSGTVAAISGNANGCL